MSSGIGRTVQTLFRHDGSQEDWRTENGFYLASSRSIKAIASASHHFCRFLYRCLSPVGSAWDAAARSDGAAANEV